MSRTNRAACLAALTGLVVSASCILPKQDFVCSTDAECRRGNGGTGFCEAVGYCSFSDASCEAGRRFAAYSGAWSGACVGAAIVDAADFAVDAADLAVEVSDFAADLAVDAAGSLPTWTPQGLANPQPLTAVWGSSANDIYAVGAQGYIIHSTGNGTWTPQTTDTNTQDQFFAVGGNGKSDVYAVTIAGNIFHSAGNGSWTFQKNVGQTLRGVWGNPTSRDVWAVGEYGTIVHSNGNGNWTPETSGTMVALGAVWGRSAQDLYAVGLTGGVVLHSTGNGMWSGLSSLQPAVAIYTVFGFSGVVYLGCDQSKIFASQGNSWGLNGSQLNDPTSGIAGIWGADAAHIFAVAFTGHILRISANGTWFEQPVGGVTRAIWGSSASDVYVVGDNGILHGP